MNFKVINRNVIVLVFAMILGNFLGILQASAAPPPHREIVPPKIPPVITLFEQTPLYSTTDDSHKPFAALTPQDVTTVDAEQAWYYKQHGEKVWIKIKTTWAGDLWMHLDYDKIGIVKPIDTNIALLWDSSLYTQPSTSTMTDIVLAPQTVHANAVFESPVSYLSNSYRIETSWLGDMWIVSQPRMLLDMEILNQEMDLPTETLYMEDYDTSSRLQRPSDAKFIPPQKVFALEKTQNGIYHVRSQDGNTFWVQPDFAQPVGVEPIDERLNLLKDVRLYMFPTMPFPTFGVLSAQTVNAFERWTDPQNELWYHIHTWAGDMWVQPDKPL
ncbi:hypothetical protein HZF08_03455 [Paenibacillus sp. CGMCC 1.16610]|uniref:Uncharacterized protein n=1 Tax=Paenibacillus anseongense TaxID=2682845 RepID=A0ABW9U8U2_9BACL|nr:MULTISPECIES: hypothetical protein [Paenibacillus]MBA2937350.1 hypothetical protein [Paenibacillus sp. CGMCC 1.16610]MVQ36408.1 hypothetical protein [Paenibacillus anseongense]